MNEEKFDLTKYLDENSWDPAAVCALTDEVARKAIAVFVVAAMEKDIAGDVKDAKASADQALRILREEQEAGRTKQAERAAREAAES